MPSERVQRQIDLFLDEAEAALRQRDWDAVREACLAVLSVDPDNGDALAYLTTVNSATTAAGEGSKANDDRATESDRPALPLSVGVVEQTPISRADPRPGWCHLLAPLWSQPGDTFGF